MLQTAASHVNPSLPQSGDECMVLPNVSAEDAKKLFPQHRQVDVPSGKGYIRITPQPQ